MLLPNDLFFKQVSDILRNGEEVQLLVSGYSMRPLLRNQRDTVIIIPYTNQPLRRFDIVLFCHVKQHILHRIVKIEGEKLTLSGDGNYKMQEHCTQQDVLGIMSHVIRPSGRIIDCNSASWQLRSRCWCALPAIVRRYLVAIAQRIWRQ